jgi:SAM-dependent methyltransferase
VELVAVYDAVINRHLAWTLVDPTACFRKWYCKLKPGGRLLVMDGNFVIPGPISSILRRLARLSDGSQVGAQGGAWAHYGQQ